MTKPTSSGSERDSSVQNNDLLKRLEGIYERREFQSPADRAALLVAGELAAVSADAAFVATVSEDGATVDVSRVTAKSKAPVRLAFPIGAPSPIAEVLRRRTTLFIESNEQLACDHPGLIRVDAADHACATIPLRGDGGGFLGVLNLGFNVPHAFSEDERASIQALAARCAAALQDELSTPSS